MKKSSLSYLTIATVVVLLAAGYAVRSRSSAGAAPAEKGIFLPTLNERVNDVARMRVVKNDGETTVEAKDGAWVVSDRSGFPAKFETVKEVIVSLSRLAIEEPKTKNPEFYERLGVQEPTEEDSKSARVILEDANGDVLADVIVGPTNRRGGNDTTYLRRHGEEQAFLCAGNMPAIDSDAKAWLERDIIKLETEDVEKVRLVHTDGEEIQIERVAFDSSQFEVVNKPEGREEKYSGVANTIASNLAYLSLDDVKPAGEVDFQASTVATVEFRRKDGQVIVVEAAQVEEEGWIRLSSFYEAPPEEPPMEGPAAVEGEAPAEGEPVPPTPILPDAVLDEPEIDPDAVRAEIESFNQRLAGWAFAVPSYKFDNLKKRMEELLKELEEGPEPPEASELDFGTPVPVSDGEGGEEGADTSMEPIDEHAGHDHGEGGGEGSHEEPRR